MKQKWERKARRRFEEIFLQEHDGFVAAVNVPR